MHIIIWKIAYVVNFFKDILCIYIFLIETILIYANVYMYMLF